MLDFSPSFIVYAPKYAPNRTALHSEPTSTAAAQFPKTYPVDGLALRTHIPPRGSFLVLCTNTFYRPVLVARE